MNDPSVLFDLDGVISNTASVHALAWKQVFDQVLRRMGKDGDFSIAVDYPRYVDGKMRFAGIQSFLLSRGISLPAGTPDDDGLDTIHGIGTVKNAAFRAMLEETGVEIFDDARDLITRLVEADFPLGLASSSKNARPVLDKAGMTGHFRTIMDGLVAERDGIASKPDPAFYVHAAAMIGRPTADCVVIEDAVSGIVSAARAGIGLVVGIDRTGAAAELSAGGAHMVVGSLSELSIDRLRGEWTAHARGSAYPNRMKGGGR